MVFQGYVLLAVVLIALFFGKHEIGHPKH